MEEDIREPSVEADTEAVLGSFIETVARPSPPLLPLPLADLEQEAMIALVRIHTFT